MTNAGTRKFQRTHACTFVLRRLEGKDFVSVSRSDHTTGEMVVLSPTHPLHNLIAPHTASLHHPTMTKPAARIGDLVLQAAPHCHAPIHPPAPTPTPLPHPALPLSIIKGAPTVMVGGAPAARVSDMTQPCVLPGCVPAGPGVISMGSPTVLIAGLPAARVGDMSAHGSCVAPIPSPTGNVMPPGCPTVLIG